MTVCCLRLLHSLSYIFAGHAEDFRLAILDYVIQQAWKFRLQQRRETAAAALLCTTDKKKIKKCINQYEDPKAFDDCSGGKWLNIMDCDSLQL